MAESLMNNTSYMFSPSAASFSSMKHLKNQHQHPLSTLPNRLNCKFTLFTSPMGFLSPNPRPLRLRSSSCSEFHGRRIVVKGPQGVPRTETSLASNSQISTVTIKQRPSLSLQSRQRSTRVKAFFPNSTDEPILKEALKKLSLRLRTYVIATAKKNINTKKKPDNHSFVPKPDEVTGPFPEAVLLKQKKVQEDGRLLPEFADADERELFESLNLKLESDLNVGQMRHYEVVYLIHEDYAEEVASLNSKVEGFLREKKGKIWRFSDWGLRRLAYKIKKAKSAHYILTNFELEAKWINEFKSMLDKDERVIRHLVIKRDEAITEDCPPPPEFHTLRAGADDSDDDEEDDMDEDDAAYEDEEDGSDWDDEGETDIASLNDDNEDEVIYVGEDDSENQNYKKPIGSNMGRRRRRTKAGKVGSR